MVKANNQDKILSTLLFFYIVFLPFEESLASSLGSILRIIGLIIIIYCIIRYFKEPIKLTNIEFLILIWLLFSFFSILWAESFEWWLYFLKIYFGQVLFLISVLIVPPKKLNVKVVRNTLILSGIIISAILILFPYSMQLTSDGRRTLIIMNTIMDPNIVCALVSLSIFSLIDTIRISKKDDKYLCLRILVLFIFILSIFLTGSRGGILSVFVAFLFWIILNFKTHLLKRKIVFYFIVAISIAIVVIPNELLERFTFESFFGLTEIEFDVHSRQKIWSYIPQLIQRRPIIGYGTGNFFEAISTVYIQTASHNMYLLLITENGIVGFLIFMSAILLTVIKLYKIKEYNALSLFLSILLICLFLDGLPFKFFWISWLYTLIKIKKHVY